MSRMCNSAGTINMGNIVAIREPPSLSIRPIRNTDVCSYLLSKITTSATN